MLSPIAAYCGTNIPGVLFIDYAPLAWINAAAWEDWTVGGNQATDITWADPAYNWLRMPLLGETIRWNETSKITPNGRVYPQRFTGIIPNLRVDISDTIEETERYEHFLIRLRDRNDKVWIMGTPETPLTFSADAGTESGGGSEYSIDFSGEAIRRAKGFVPTITP